MYYLFSDFNGKIFFLSKEITSKQHLLLAKKTSRFHSSIHKTNLNNLTQFEAS